MRCYQLFKIIDVAAINIWVRVSIFEFTMDHVISCHCVISPWCCSHGLQEKRGRERERTILTGQKHFNYIRLSKIGIKPEQTANWSMSTRNTETPTAKENCIHS